MFSGHAALAFAAAAASGPLFAEHVTDPRARAAVWGTTTMLAATTANLRVRSGRHFYSDVVVGSLVGGAIGTAIPALHAGKLYAPSGGEWAAIGGGLALGVLGSELVPLGDEGAPKLRLAPLVTRGGAGFAIGGAL
jgi:hypothetical protein